MSLSALSSSLSATAPIAAGAGNRSSLPSATQALSAEDEAVLRKLQARDREVRQHEQAHLAASGGLATSGARFSYQRGPDGVDYAVGGEVSIDTAPGRTPEETLQRARQVRAAALAPAQPSGPDLAVAAQATRMALDAQTELAQDTRGSTPPAREVTTDVQRAADAALAMYARTTQDAPSRVTDSYA